VCLPSRFPASGKRLRNVDAIDSCIRYRDKGYSDVKTLDEDRQGVTADESDKGYKNLYGMFFII
jgi:hypothetical protein